ncbi:MAG: M23 family metallopeptidase [Prolixibacteraceae bacterium]|nr:M23 family metallopeptidase [Prolixibacteraceae bacterium]
MAEKARNFIKKITRNFRLTIIDQERYMEVFSTSVSRLKAWLLLFSVFLMSLLFILLLFFYTPFKYLVPGYPSPKIVEMMAYNAMMVDSLEQELMIRDSYLEKIRAVISGEIVDEQPDKTGTTEQVSFAPMDDDAIFNELIGPDKYKFSYLSSDEDFSELSRINFFTPIKGVIINKYNATPGHFGTDIVGKENSFIAAVLDGTVIFAEFSVTTGYVVQIQHDFNLISIYKHNYEILVRPGDQVKAGTVIAIMGDEGEYSTGPHLHFELWQNGVPLNPEHYITF